MSNQTPHHLGHALVRDLGERCYGWLEALADGCVVVDATFTVRYCNPAFAVAWDVSAEDLPGALLTETLPGFAGSAWHKLCDRVLLDGRPEEADIRLRDRWYQVRAHPVPDGALLLLADVTAHRRSDDEQAKLHQRLHEVQKHESLDVLVGGVAHDLNNLLVGMLNGAELLTLELPHDSPLQATTDMICKAALRARDVARQMVVCARKGRSARRPFDLNRLVSENLPLLRSSFPHGVVFEAVLYDRLPAVSADAGQMQQLLMNLLVNAAEALPSTGGSVRVTTGVAAGPEPGAPAAGATAGFVFVEVADDGAGMTPDVQARIFEPFFTTKTTGGGLGLAAVRNVIRAHGGVVRLKSNPGQGTTFRVYLPAAAPTPPERESAAATPGEVLIVDDEAHICDIVRRMLRVGGFPSRAASNGEEALALVRDNPEIVVVILDLKMPGMGGMEMLRQLFDIRPQLKAILTSGWAEQLPPSDDPRLIGFLPKPYVFEQLIAMVRESVGQAPRPSI